MRDLRSVGALPLELVRLGGVAGSLWRLDLLELSKGLLELVIGHLTLLTRVRSNTAGSDMDHCTRAALVSRVQTKGGGAHGAIKIKLVVDTIDPLLREVLLIEGHLSHLYHAQCTRRSELI